MRGPAASITPFMLRAAAYRPIMAQAAPPATRRQQLLRRRTPARAACAIGSPPPAPRTTIN